MYRDIVEWRGQNPPPATMMIISNPVRGDFCWDLARLQQRSQYNLFVAYPKSLCFISPLLTSEEWVWGKLLGFRDNNRIIETRSAPLAMLCCKSCNFDCQIPEKLRKHLSSYKHARQVSILSLSLSLYLYIYIYLNTLSNLFESLSTTRSLYTLRTKKSPG